MLQCLRHHNFGKQVEIITEHPLCHWKSISPISGQILQKSCPFWTQHGIIILHFPKHFCSNQWFQGQVILLENISALPANRRQRQNRKGNPVFLLIGILTLPGKETHMKIVRQEFLQNLPPKAPIKYLRPRQLTGQPF